MLFLGAWGKDDLWKKPEGKNLVTLSFQQNAVKYNFFQLCVQLNETLSVLQCLKNVGKTPQKYDHQRHRILNLLKSFRKKMGCISTVLLNPLWVGISYLGLCSAISRTLWPNITTGMASSVPLSPYQFFSSQSLVTLFTVFYPEMEFLDISVTKDSIALCYSQSLPLANFKKAILYSGFKNSYKKSAKQENWLYLWVAFCRTGKWG